MGRREINITKSDPIEWILDGFPISNQLKLFDDISFAYELKLAKMELSRFYDDLDTFRKRAAYFEEVAGKKTNHYYISGIKGKGQIGHTNQYLTHWFYPYKAKFHPQMIKALINWMGLKGSDVLLDPFVGSGTALIEAKTIGVNSIGIDIDPICLLQSRVKCDLLEMPSADLESISPKDAFYFFDRKRKTSLNLEKFVSELSENDHDLTSNEKINNFYLLCYLYALSDYTYIKKNIWQAFNDNLHAILVTVRKFNELKKRLNIQLGKVEEKKGDAKGLDLPNESIDGIVTSPPYSIAVDYIKNDLHALEYLGVNLGSLRKNMIGLRGNGDERVRLYYEDMKKSFGEMHRVMKDLAYCIVIIGDVTYNMKRLNIKDNFIAFAKEVGLSCIDVIRRPILGGFARLRYEYIIIFQKM
jgi:DNA modification methylase